MPQLEPPLASQSVANATIFSGQDAKTSSTIKNDITGDGKKDTVKFKITGIDNSYAKALKIYVNNKLCRTVKGFEGNGFYTSWVTVKYLRMKNGTLKCVTTCTTDVKYLNSNSSTSGFGQTFLQARKAFKAYTAADLKTVKFKVKANQQVKITKVAIKSKSLSFRITTTSGKSGWIRALKKGIGTYGGDTLFYGTSMAA